MADGIEVKVDGNGGLVGALLLALPWRPQLPSVDPELHRIFYLYLLYFCTLYLLPTGGQSWQVDPRRVENFQYCLLLPVTMYLSSAQLKPDHVLADCELS